MTDRGSGIRNIFLHSCENQLPWDPHASVPSCVSFSPETRHFQGKLSPVLIVVSSNQSEKRKKKKQRTEKPYRPELDSFLCHLVSFINAN